MSESERKPVVSPGIPAGVTTHGHCEICGAVVTHGYRFCSQDCEAKHRELLKQKKRQMWVLVAIMVGTLVLFNLMRLGLV